MESVAAAPVDEQQRCLMLHKLAFLGIVFHQVEIAAEALRVAESSKALSAVRQQISSLDYGRFLTDFTAALSAQQAVFPTPFASQFSFDDSRSRFATAGQRGLKWLELLRDWCVRKPSRWRFIKAVLRPAVSTSKRAKLFFKLLASGKPFWRHPALQWSSPVERVLRRYGLDEQADTVRRNRRRYAPYCEA